MCAFPMTYDLCKALPSTDTTEDTAYLFPDATAASGLFGFHRSSNVEDIYCQYLINVYRHTVCTVIWNKKVVDNLLNCQINMLYSKSQNHFFKMIYQRPDKHAKFPPAYITETQRTKENIANAEV